MSTIILPRQCSHLARLAAGEQGRYTMNGILVEPGEGGSFRLVATDGKALGIVQGEGAKPGPFTEASLEGGPDGDLGAVGAGAIVPFSDWAAAFRLGKRPDPVGLCLSGDAFLMACGAQTIRGRTVEGRFPDYRAVLPRGVPLCRVRFNPVLLGELLRVAAAMQDKGGEQVELLFYGGKDSPLGLMAQCQDGLFFDALIMPLT